MKLSAEAAYIDLFESRFYFNRYSTENIVLVEGGGNVGIGIDDPTQGRLVVDGKIVSEEVKVENVIGADFVFEDNYKLSALSEVEQYIKANRHLPEIPSAKKMQADGVQLGVFNMLLLQKIEELTLYTIEQQKQIDKLKAKIEE